MALYQEKDTGEGTFDMIDRGSLVLAKSKSYFPETYSQFLEEYPLAVARVSLVIRESDIVVIESKNNPDISEYAFRCEDLIEVES